MCCVGVSLVLCGGSGCVVWGGGMLCRVGVYYVRNDSLHTPYVREYTHSLTPFTHTYKTSGCLCEDVLCGVGCIM